MTDIRRRLFAALIAMALALGPIAATRAAAESPSPGTPLATDDSYTTAEDTPLHVDAPGLLANDNPGPGTCVIGAGIDSTIGAIDMDAHDGSFTMTPASNFNGVATFWYLIQAAGGPECDGGADSEATVTVTVTPVNDAPTAIADFFAALANRTLNVAAPGVLGNDSDIDDDSLTAIKVNNPAHGTLTLAADGAFSYTPANGYTGPDAFSYRASDGQATSPVRVVNLTVSAIPPTPTPTPVPTPTPTPTASPEPSPTESPFPSDSGLPSPSPLDTALLGSPSPSPAPAGPVASESGPPILALGALGLLVLLLGVAGVYFVRSQRAGDDGGFDSGGSGGTHNRGSDDTDADDDRYDPDDLDGGDGDDGDSDGGDADD